MVVSAVIYMCVCLNRQNGFQNTAGSEEDLIIITIKVFCV